MDIIDETLKDCCGELYQILNEVTLRNLKFAIGCFMADCNYDKNKYKEALGIFETIYTEIINESVAPLVLKTKDDEPPQEIYSPSQLVFDTAKIDGRDNPTLVTFDVMPPEVKEFNSKEFAAMKQEELTKERAEVVAYAEDLIAKNKAKIDGMFDDFSKKQDDEFRRLQELN